MTNIWFLYLCCCNIHLCTSLRADLDKCNVYLWPRNHPLSVRSAYLETIKHFLKVQYIVKLQLSVGSKDDVSMYLSLSHVH